MLYQFLYFCPGVQVVESANSNNSFSSCFQVLEQIPPLKQCFNFFFTTEITFLGRERMGKVPRKGAVGCQIPGNGTGIPISLNENLHKPNCVKSQCSCIMLIILTFVVSTTVIHRLRSHCKDLFDVIIQCCSFNDVF